MKRTCCSDDSDVGATASTLYSAAAAAHASIGSGAAATTRLAAERPAEVSQAVVRCNAAGVSAAVCADAEATDADDAAAANNVDASAAACASAASAAASLQLLCSFSASAGASNTVSVGIAMEQGRRWAINAACRRQQHAQARRRCGQRGSGAAAAATVIATADVNGVWAQPEYMQVRLAARKPCFGKDIATLDYIAQGGHRSQTIPQKPQHPTEATESRRSHRIVFPKWDTGKRKYQQVPLRCGFCMQLSHMNAVTSTA
eukprot:366017-Chlamydomonas_euryale.AAC.4